MMKTIKTITIIEINYLLHQNPVHEIHRSPPLLPRRCET